MRWFVLAALVACGGSTASQPALVSNSVPVAQAPPPAEPTSTCGCTSARCKGEDNTKYVIAMMCSFRERMCACKDTPCAEGVNDDYTKWMQGLARDASTSKAVTVSEDDTRRVADDATKYQECYAKVASPNTNP